MLQQLSIKNYAIIQDMQIRFDGRLNIITGETGAGKSILMGALGLILGDRADTGVLLKQEEKCVVEGIFSIPDYNLQSFFENYELDYDKICVIRREIAPSGKSRSFINDTPVSLQQLRELGTRLVEIVSQHQTLELNDRTFQLALVDALSGNGEKLTRYRLTYNEYKRLQAALEQKTLQEQKAREEEDYLRFVLKELTDANLQPDEQAELESRQATLSHAESIRQAGFEARQLLEGEQGTVDDQLRTVRNLLAIAGKHHPALLQMVARIDSAIIELKDITSELDHLDREVQVDPAALASIEERLQLLFNLQKKHRVGDNSGLIALRNKIEQEIKSLEHLNDELEALQTELKKVEASMVDQAVSLHKARAKTIPVLEKKVGVLLQQVEMPNARLIAQMIRLNQPGPDGSDSVELLFAANPGSEPKPLHKVASGGELSRLMLCIKSLLSDEMALPTIVFDEIDTGISGETALKVAQVMKQHAQKHQVLAITHLPQIAGKADLHLLVIKSGDQHSTNVDIKTLDKQGRLSEIARMLHGDNPSHKVLEAARELIGV